MAKILYDDDEPKGSFSPGLAARLDPTKQWLKHYSNQLYLQFIASKGDRLERWQANKELAICQRKLDYWAKRPGFDQEDATAGANLLKKQWK